MNSPYAGKEVAPPHLRCRRSDGKKWQCHRYAFGTLSVCEHHYRLRCKKKRSPMKVLIRRKGAAPATEPLHDHQTRLAPSTEPPHDQQTTKPPPDGRELMRGNASAPAVTAPQQTRQLRPRKVVIPSAKPPLVQPLKKRLQHGEEAEATPAAAVTVVTSFLPNGVKVVSPVPSQTGFGNAGEGSIFQRNCRSKFSELFPVAKPLKGLPYRIGFPGTVKRVCRSPPVRKR